MLPSFSVEIKEEDNEWTEAKRVVDSLAVTLKDLKAGSRYKFRVRAENVHGMSEPSVVSEEVMIDFPDTEGNLRNTLCVLNYTTIL